MARQEGFEPPTYCLEGSCSILLSYWRVSSREGLSLLRKLLPPVERMMGIEPTYPAWKAGVLPLNYIRTARPQMFSLESIPSTESIVNSFFFAETHKKTLPAPNTGAHKPRASLRRHYAGRGAPPDARTCTSGGTRTGQNPFRKHPPRGEGRSILICDRACWSRTAARR